MIVLLVVGLVSCNIMEMSPVRSSHNDSIASCRTSFLQYNGDAPVRSSHNDSIASCRTSFLQYNGDVASALVS